MRSLQPPLQKLSSPWFHHRLPPTFEQNLQYQAGDGPSLRFLPMPNAQRWTNRGAGKFQRRPPGRVRESPCSSTDGREQGRSGEDDGLQGCKVQGKKADLLVWESNPHVCISKAVGRPPKRGSFRLEPKWLRNSHYQALPATTSEYQPLPATTSFFLLFRRMAAHGRTFRKD